MPPTLRAPYPYWGGKSRVAPLIWERFGMVENFVDPFFGSGAVLLGNPNPPATETVNDLDGLLCNFWRALQADPETVAYWADFPVDETHLHSVHLWLLSCKPEIERLIADPDWYDAKAAGRWVWGLCAWIGSGWCSGRGPWRLEDGVLTKGDGSEDDGELLGVAKQLPHLGDAGQGINRKLPHLGNAGRGDAAPSRGNLYDYLGALSERLRRVRITCGDWTRVLGPSVTTKHGLTAVLLDPPYSHAERKSDLYNQDQDVFGDVREWAWVNGTNPSLRIALCGYDDGTVMPHDWTCVRWKAAGGYGSQGKGRGRENAARECVWFNKSCRPPAVRQGSLFAAAD